MKPTLSFIIPVRNSSHLLQQSLAAVNAQKSSGIPFEIIVLDNGSTDDSAAVAEAAGARVLVIPGDNVSQLRNRGSHEAVAELIAFVDADNEIAEGWCSAVNEIMLDPEVAAAGAAYTAPDDGTWVTRTGDYMRGHKEGSSSVDWLAAGNLVIRKPVFEALNGFDTSLETCEDVDLCARIRAAGHDLISDSRLRSVHRGDPRHLKDIFRGELWRGRDNLRVSFRHKIKPRDLPSILFPIIILLAAVAAIVLSLFQPGNALFYLLGAVAVLGFFALLNAAKTVWQAGAFKPLLALQTVFFSATYYTARALALVWQVGHHR